jgi:hypothetical protein
MNEQPEPMACAQCTAPLNRDGGGYRHPMHHRHDGHQPVPVPLRELGTVARVCDFCTDPYPLWIYRGPDMAVLAAAGTAETGYLHGFGGDWSACAACTTDIGNGNLNGPIDRAVRSAQSYGLSASPDLYAALHQTFHRERHPGRTLITTTAWPAQQLAAADLPKIRDRLTGFLRSDIGLPDQLGLNDTRHGLASSLDRSRLVWVDPPFTELAEHAAAQLPAIDADGGLAPGADGLIIWAQPITTQQAAAMSWMQTATQLCIVSYRGVGGGLDGKPLQQLRHDIGWLAPMRTIVIPLGKPLPSAENDPVAVLAATWLLIAQQAAETVSAPISKPTRKHYARQQRPLPDVRIVRIRQHQTTTGPAGAQSASAPRQAMARVWVTGHWRNQAYGPGRTLRRPTYIHPFLRGPHDAPIKLTTTVRVLRTPPDSTT